MRRKLLRLAMSVLFLGVLFAGVFPCTAEEKDTLVFSWGSNAGGDLNPHLYSPNQMYAQDMIYEPLVNYTSSGEIVPCLAESWDVSADGLRYTFYLRRGVEFSDGTPWNAKAAKANFDALLANAKRHAWLGLFGLMKDVEVVDDYTIALVLNSTNAATLEDLSLIRPIRFLSPAAFVDGGTDKGIKAPIGTGPWVHAEAKKGESDLFVRNEKYWGKKPSFAKIFVKVIPDSEARSVAMLTGDVDLIFGSSGHGSSQISVEAFKRLQSTGQFDTAVSGPNGTRALAVNSAKEPTNDLAVRRAMQHAINRDAIAQGVFLGLEQPAPFLFDTNVPYCDVGLTPYSYDPEKAKELLEAAGWVMDGEYRRKGDVPLSMTFCFVGTDATQKAVAEIVQSDLKKVGMRVELVPQEGDAFYKVQQEGNFNIVGNNTWGAPYDPNAFCSSMRVPSHADYRAQEGLPMKKAVDEDIARILSTTSEEERKALYKKLLTTLHEQAVYFPLTYETLVQVRRKELADIPFPPFLQQIPFAEMHWR